MEERRKRRKNNKQQQKNKQKSERDRIQELYHSGQLLASTTFDHEMISQGGTRYLTPEQREDYLGRRVVREKIRELQLEHMRITQHTGPIPEVMRQIEIDCWNEYNNNNKNKKSL